MNKVCPTCRKEFFTYAKSQVYCSRECFHGPVEDRFWSKVAISESDECWNWLGGIKSTGRGNFWFRKKTAHAHRVAWILTYGPIPSGMQICHHCDNGACCNPAHLFMGTQSDNIKDMVNKRRHPWLLRRGSTHYIAKLTEEQVLEIRRKYIPRKYSQQKLADEYGVGRTTIQQIIENRAWTHV